MGLIEKIEELQNQPEVERKKIFTVTLTLSMLVIIAIWITLLGHNLRSLGEERADTAPSPTALVWESVQGAVNDLKKGVAEGMNNINK